MARIAEEGGRPGADFEYLNNQTGVHVICSNGHDAYPRPQNVLAGQGLCWECSGTSPMVGERRFLAALEASGSSLAAGAEYKGNKVPVMVTCPAGHTLPRLPAQVKSGAGCRACAGQDPSHAKARFLQRLRHEGARLAPGAAYKGAHVRVRLICAEGHDCNPTPAAVNYGQGVCQECVGTSPDAASRRFVARLAEHGARLAEDAVYENNRTPIHVICEFGHDCHPSPHSVLQGQGPCWACSGTDPRVAEAEFLRRLNACGAKLAVDAAYRDSKTRVPVICAAGHECAPYPQLVNAGGVVCITCAGLDPVASRATALRRLAEHGAVLAEDAVWGNNKSPIKVVCAAGHTCYPTPSNLISGHGPCEECRVSFDRVYLMWHPIARAIKIGIASGRARERRHSSRGYQLLGEWTGLDHKTARSTELVVLAEWRRREIRPVGLAPRDGRTETAPLDVLLPTVALLIGLHGRPSRTGGATGLELDSGVQGLCA